MAIAAWRFRKISENVMQKLDIVEQKRYRSQFIWFFKRVDAAVENAGLRIINVEGKPYDIGMAVNPLNLDDFSPNDELYVEQVIEPIIMDSTSIIKTGTVVLGRVGS